MLITWQVLPQNGPESWDWVLRYNFPRPGYFSEFKPIWEHPWMPQVLHPPLRNFSCKIDAHWKDNSVSEFDPVSNTTYVTFTWECREWAARQDGLREIHVGTPVATWCRLKNSLRMREKRKRNNISSNEISVQIKRS